MRALAAVARDGARPRLRADCRTPEQEVFGVCRAACWHRAIGVRLWRVLLLRHVDSRAVFPAPRWCADGSALLPSADGRRVRLVRVRRASALARKTPTWPS